jgi:hypothetical protein
MTPERIVIDPATMGVSTCSRRTSSPAAATLRDWEGCRAPDASANNCLLVIKYAPKTVEKAMAKAGETLHA